MLEWSVGTNLSSCHTIISQAILYISDQYLYISDELSWAPTKLTSLCLLFFVMCLVMPPLSLKQSIWRLAKAWLNKMFRKWNIPQGQEDGSAEAGVTDNCEPPLGGFWELNPALWKSSQHSWPLSHLSNPFMEFFLKLNAAMGDLFISPKANYMLKKASRKCVLMSHEYPFPSC